MLKLDLVPSREKPFRVLCLGAHCDDIEIGCGGTLLTLLRDHPNLCFDWVVFSSSAPRARETKAAADRFLQGAKEKRVDLKEFRNGFFPDEWAGIKNEFEAIKQRVQPDLIFTHYHRDLHQDHRTVAELTWNTFRDHLILEYEIPKYDPDLGTPNLFVDLGASIAAAKARNIVECFETQRSKHWFTEDTFLALTRLRGIQAASAHAEAFYARKVAF